MIVFLEGLIAVPGIRPVSDLRNHFAEISRTVHEAREPVILTKNGYGDMVVISYEDYQNIQYDMMIMRELRAAEVESETTGERAAHEDVISDIRNRIRMVNSADV